MAPDRVCARRLDVRQPPPQPRGGFVGCCTRSSRRSLSAPSEECTRPPPRHTTSTPTQRPAPCSTSAVTACTCRARDRAAPPSYSRNGLGSTSANWARVTADVSRTTRVCAYDRAGQGWSDDIGAPQDGLAIAADLHNLLAVAGEPGPYLLVGHSAGGTYVMTYAAQYPDEVAGMVLLDSMSPYEFTALPGFASEQSMMRRGLGVLPSLARLGATQLVPTSAWSSLSEPAASQVQAFSSSPRGLRNMRDEQSMYPRVFDQAKALTSLHGKPLVVVTATESIRKNTEWTDLQDRLAALSSNSQHRVADATHQGLIEAEATFGPAVLAVTDVVQSIRTQRPVTVS